jgi:predicted nuclease of predicted toxin-antitoxin system
MRFLVDAQLPPALARWFADRGLAATPVRELGLRDSDDGSIWNFAVAGDWVVVTKDEDFVVRCMSSANAPRVLWLRVGNCTNRVLFVLLEPLWEEIRKSVADGEKVIEVRA